MEKVLKLSDQAIGALMMTLQKCLSEQIDIVELLRGWDIKESDDGLVVLNPPVVAAPETDEEEQDA